MTGQSPQGKTGSSIGKSLLKFKVVNEKSWRHIGFGLSLVHQLADKIMSTVCVPLDPRPLPPGPHQQ